MKAQIVSFHCVLRNRIGKVLSSTFNQDVMTQSESQGEMLPALALELQNLHKGEKRRIALTAEQAYGFYDPHLSMEIARKKLDHVKDIHAGDQIFTRGEDGAPRMYRVVRLVGDSVVLDANHPLAGEDLVFEIEATEARDATESEIEDSLPENPLRYLH